MYIVRLSNHQRVHFYDLTPVAGRGPVEGIASPSHTTGLSAREDSDSEHTPTSSGRPPPTMLVVPSSPQRLSIYA